MKFTSSANTALFLLLFGALVLPASAQENKQDENHDHAGTKDRQPQRQKPQEKQAPRQHPSLRQPKRPLTKPVPHDHHPRHTVQQSRSWQQQRGWQKSGAWQGHNSWEGNRAGHWETDHRTWAQRGGYGGPLHSPQ